MMEPILTVIEAYDRLLSRERFAEAGDLLRREIARRLEPDPQGTLSLYNELMGFERQYGTNERAVAAADEALSLLRALALTDSRPAAYVLLNAATVFKNAGDENTALTYYRRAEALFKRYYPAGAKDFAGLYNNMAACFLHESDWRTAAYYYERAAGILSRHSDACDLAVTYYNLAVLYARFSPLTDEAARYAAQGRQALAVPEKDRDAYFYYTCRKAAAASAALGLFLDEDRYTRLAEDYYGRDRTQ